MLFKILKATYGDKDADSLDVTSIVSEKVSDGRLAIAVTNQTFKKDPAPLKRKNLKVEYELDGEKHSKYFQEGVIAELPYPEKLIRYPARFTLNLPEVTLSTACWGNASFLSSAVWAYKRFKDRVTFGEKIFFISEDIDYSEYKRAFEDEGIQVKPLHSGYSLADYSHLAVKGLNEHINTDFVMLFQNDGFIDNVDKWTDRFLDYDYIGAPWWYKDHNNVGNGGFSVRSRKLLEVLAVDPHIKKVVPEDHHICRTYGDYLREHHGIEFAPEELALQFSVEHGTYRDQFGFHGTWQLEAYLRRTSS